MSAIRKCEENPFDDEGEDFASCVPCREPSSTDASKTVVRCLWCHRAIVKVGILIPYTIGFFENA